MRKDKEKVLDEVWTEERVKSFLNVRSHDDVEEDFHMLLKAYQSMRAEDFAKFVNFFTNDGRSVNARNPAGKTVLDIVREHRRSGEYVEILKMAGAE
ncbi:MAG: PA4642 family protein [Pseudomonadota bacterium]